jgi:hypothetical protein
MVHERHSNPSEPLLLRPVATVATGRRSQVAQLQGVQRLMPPPYSAAHNDNEMTGGDGPLALQHRQLHSNRLTLDDFTYDERID